MVDYHRPGHILYDLLVGACAHPHIYIYHVGSIFCGIQIFVSYVCLLIHKNLLNFSYIAPPIWYHRVDGIAIHKIFSEAQDINLT